VLVAVYSVPCKYIFSTQKSQYSRSTGHKQPLTLRFKATFKSKGNDAYIQETPLTNRMELRFFFCKIFSVIE
jgi:hypothetical protein